MAAGDRFCILGELELSLATSPESWSEKVSHDYAEHAIISSKPIIQSIGNKLDEIRLEFNLNAGASDIASVWHKLNEYKQDSDVCPLVMGNGEYLGEFVITELSFDRKSTWADGTPLHVTIGCSLKEYVASAALTITPRQRPAVKSTGKNSDTKTTARPPIGGA